MGNQQDRPVLQGQESVLMTADWSQIQNVLSGRDAKARNEKISRDLKEDFQKEAKYMKLLVLGAGESGKSTIIKQMKLIHSNVDGREQKGFTDQERLVARKAIYVNIVESLANLLDAIEFLNIKGWEKVIYSDTKKKTKNRNVQFIEEYGSVLMSCGSKKHGEVEILDEKIIPTQEIIKAFKDIWNHETIQKAYARRSEFQLNDSTSYFMTNLDHLCAVDCQLNDQDVLRSRVKTTGVSKIQFTYKDIEFRMFDVGGQRSERKKWIHCFDNVTAVLFVISIAEYDQVLEEDATVNRMEESMNLFDDIVNNKFFNRKSFIIFFNKKDLFEEKIRTKAIKEYFPDFEGDEQSFTQTSDFLIKKYLSKNKGEEKSRTLYPYLTTGTDTEAVKYVFCTVADIILAQCLGQILF